MKTQEPHTVAELCQQVKQAIAAKQPIYPVGGNTQSHWLAPITTPGIILSTSGLNRLIDFPADDMTVTVEAGMRMVTLQRLLHEKGMWLPLDVPNVEDATVGGSIAANVHSPRRTGFGTWRDYVLGLHWINDQGDEVKAGGRVVKNVAGYDFCKLFIGSLGTLGIITQVTLKVRPLPEETGVITGQIANSELTAWCHNLRKSSLRPSVAMLERAGDHWMATLAFEESRAAVAWQLEEVRHRIPGSQPAQGETARSALHSLAQTKLRSELRWQAILPKQYAPTWTASLPATLHHTRLHILTGLVEGELLNDDLDTTLHTVNQLRQTAAQFQGHLILHCPPVWRTALQPYGPPRPDWHLMRQVKHALDPQNLYQPGRYEVLHGE